MAAVSVRRTCGPETDDGRRHGQFLRRPAALRADEHASAGPRWADPPRPPPRRHRRRRAAWPAPSPARRRAARLGGTGIRRCGPPGVAVRVPPRPAPRSSARPCGRCASARSRRPRSRSGPARPARVGRPSRRAKRDRDGRLPTRAAHHVAGRCELRAEHHRPPAALPIADGDEGARPERAAPARGGGGRRPRVPARPGRRRRRAPRLCGASPAGPAHRERSAEGGLDAREQAVSPGGSTASPRSSARRRRSSSCVAVSLVGTSTTSSRPEVTSAAAAHDRHASSPKGENLARLRSGRDAELLLAVEGGQGERGTERGLDDRHRRPSSPGRCRPACTARAVAPADGHRGRPLHRRRGPTAPRPERRSVEPLSTPAGTSTW